LNVICTSIYLFLDRILINITTDVTQEDILILIDLDKLGKYGDTYKIINMSTEMV